jgi:glycosyltransferase involved in cell wall biosynthesis
MGHPNGPHAITAHYITARTGRQAIALLPSCASGRPAQASPGTRRCIDSMRICYLLLSPTFGMHQYTADPANQVAQAGHKVHLVTTARAPRDRYHPTIALHTPVDTVGTGLAAESLRLDGLRATQRTIRSLQPDLVHITGPHLWNVPLLTWLRRAGVPTVHTLHDLDPHSGTPYGRLLYAWNWMVLHLANHVLVHGRRYRQRLLAAGMAPDRVTYAPLLHLFLGYRRLAEAQRLAGEVRHEPWALFFGRLERYKGIAPLLAAHAQGEARRPNGRRLVLAGSGSLGVLWSGVLPPGVEVRNRLIGDQEALDLFRHCGLLVLPYLDATQSALIGAAYFFRKPVVASRAGALSEYVQEGRTGWLVEPGDVAGLAACLDQALSDIPRLARMGETGRAWYDAERTRELAALLHMYERLAAQSQGQIAPSDRRSGIDPAVG